MNERVLSSVELLFLSENVTTKSSILICKFVASAMYSRSLPSGILSKLSSEIRLVETLVTSVSPSAPEFVTIGFLITKLTPRLASLGSLSSSRARSLSSPRASSTVDPPKSTLGMIILFNLRWIY